MIWKCKAGTGSVSNLLTLPLWTRVVSQPFMYSPPITTHPNPVSAAWCLSEKVPLQEAPGALSFPSFTLSGLPANPRGPLRLRLGMVPPEASKMNSCIIVMRLLLSGPFLFGRQGRWGGEGTCACDQGNCRALWNQSKCAAVLRVGWAISLVKRSTGSLEEEAGKESMGKVWRKRQRRERKVRMMKDRGEGPLKKVSG